MTLLKTYIIPRILQWVLVIFIGVTLTFLIPRLSPINPVQQAVGRLTAFQTLSPEATVELQESLEDLYGLNGTLFEQYIAFWQRILTGDLGPSFSSFPMSVNAMIANGIWWTIGLLSISILDFVAPRHLPGHTRGLFPQSVVGKDHGGHGYRYLPGALLHHRFYLAHALHLLLSDLSPGGWLIGHGQL